MCGDLGRAFMTEVEVMPVQILLGVGECPHRRPVRLDQPIIVLDSLARRLIVECILPELVVMLSHHPDVLNALLLAHTFQRILTVHKSKLGHSVHDWACRGRADAPVC